MMFNSRNPPALPSWPRWIETSQTITVTGRHVSLGRRNLNHVVAILIAILLLANYWAPPFFHLVTPLTRWTILTIQSFQLQWTAGGIVMSFALGLLFGGEFFVYFCALHFLNWLFRKKTTLIFHTDHMVIVRPLFNKRLPLNVTDQLDFFVKVHPSCEPDAQATHSAEAWKIIRRSRFFFLRFGLNEIRIATFLNPKKADNFAAMCRVALQHINAKSIRAFAVVMAQPVQAIGNVTRVVDTRDGSAHPAEPR